MNLERRSVRRRQSLNRTDVGYSRAKVPDMCSNLLQYCVYVGKRKDFSRKQPAAALAALVALRYVLALRCINFTILSLKRSTEFRW